MKREHVIDTGSGSPIYLVPRRDGRPGFLVAQGASHVLFGRHDLRELQRLIAEELGEHTRAVTPAKARLADAEVVSGYPHR
jgi:hypothetical protein